MSAAEAVSVEVPDIGDFEEVPIIEVHVSPGDTVAADDPLLTLESDKATMDVPAPFGGTVREVQVKIGDTVSQGTPLLTIEPADEDGAQSGERAGAAASDGAPSEADAPAAVQSAADAEQASPVEDEETAQPGTDGAGSIYASPSVRRLARELGVDLIKVQGSGRKGRITKEDVQSASDKGSAPAAPAGPDLGLELAPPPSVEFERFGPVERVERGRIKRIAAPNLSRNWVTIPHVTHHDEADITELEAWRKQLNEQHGSEDWKVTMVSFLVIACVATLKEFPDFNSSLDGDQLVLKRYYNIGFAADTAEGLLVPVIKDADEKGLLEIARELGALSGKARQGKLAPGDMQASTFTISSLGGIGGTAFTPIINAPEVAILGVTRAAIKPAWDGDEFVPRLLLPLSLSYDHRVIDGAAAARFVGHLAGVLSDLRQALL